MGIWRWAGSHPPQDRGRAAVGLAADWPRPVGAAADEERWADTDVIDG